MASRIKNKKGLEPFFAHGLSSFRYTTFEFVLCVHICLLYLGCGDIAKSAVALGKFKRTFLQRAIATAARREVGDLAVFLQWIVATLRNPATGRVRFVLDLDPLP